MSDLEAFDFSQKAECTGCHQLAQIILVSESSDKSGETVAESRLCQACLDKQPKPPAPTADAQGEV